MFTCSFISINFTQTSKYSLKQRDMISPNRKIKTCQPKYYFFLQEKKVTSTAKDTEIFNVKKILTL